MRRFTLLAMLVAATGFGALSPPAQAQEPLLSRGDAGPAVAEWQASLNDWLQLARTERGRLAEDGVFGPKTEAATLELQRAANVSADGLVGPETRSALSRLLERSRQGPQGQAGAVEWPIPIPSWFWDWAQWYLHRGEYRDEPFRAEASRPSEAPYRIPEWAWRRLGAILGNELDWRAQLFVEDVVVNRTGASPATVDVNDDVLRSDSDRDWALVTGSTTEAAGDDLFAAWLRLERGRWVLHDLGLNRFRPQPQAPVPCDLYPAFSEPSC